MELQQFVSETLTQIVAGVKDSQERIRKLGGYVNPAARVSRAPGDNHFTSIGDGQSVFLVEFDVAVSVSEGTGTNAGAKLQVASLLSLGAGGNSDSSKSQSSRITFKVPLAMPVDEVSKNSMLRKEAELDAKVRAHNSNSGSWAP